MSLHPIVAGQNEKVQNRAMRDTAVWLQEVKPHVQGSYQGSQKAKTWRTFYFSSVTI